MRIVWSWEGVARFWSISSTTSRWQSIVVRDATCEVGGKVLNICKNCGECEETITPKGEHKYGVSVVKATCVSPGYTVKECEVCGDRHITDIQNAKPHSYEAITTPANCESGGYTLHLCKGCGSSFITDYTNALGHSFDKGTTVTSPSCTGEGVTEYRCERCGYHYVDGDAASGHTPGEAATCTHPQLCTVCGAVLAQAQGHSYKAQWKAAAGELWEEDGFVFTNEIGQHLRSQTLYHHFKRLAAKIGCPNARYHDLRHPYVKSKTKLF